MLLIDFGMLWNVKNNSQKNRRQIVFLKRFAFDMTTKAWQFFLAITEYNVENYGQNLSCNWLQSSNLRPIEPNIFAYG